MCSWSTTLCTHLQSISCKNSSKFKNQEAPIHRTLEPNQHPNPQIPNQKLPKKSNRLAKKQKREHIQLEIYSFSSDQAKISKTKKQ